MARSSGSARQWMAVVATGIALIVAGCGGDQQSAGEPQRTSSEPTVQQVAAKPSAKLTLNPANAAVDVSPNGPFTVSVADGVLASVALTNADGERIAGALNEDKTTWTAGEPLGFGKTYTWSGNAIGADGEESPVAGTFGTVTPGRKVSASLNVGDDQVYGVAMPIAVEFTSPVADKATVQKALTVQTSVPTEGAWAWLDDKHVHWRPKAYWTPGTQVTVDAKLYGVAHGDGAYGSQDVSVRFSIGRALIATADTQTHRFIVTKDGQQLFDFPASYGLEEDPGRVTRSGIHVVISKSREVPMTNRRYNYENVLVPFGVQISYNGEYVHGYEKSRAAQGSENVSHGCANLAPENAELYYNEVIPGDPVNVTGSSVPLSEEDGTYYDWAVDWNTWIGKSAL